MPDWENFFDMLYGNRRVTDVTASALKAVNVLGEAGVPGAKGLMDYVDEKAYLMGSQGSSPSRDTAYIPEEVGADPYSGIYSDEGETWNLNEGPNLLKIFLGMEENVLPESEYRPTSWTKGDPEQGWRSIKDYSELRVRKPDRGDLDFTSEWEHQQYTDKLQKVNLMREAVASGEYTPEMAVKDKNFPGLRYDTSVNLGHMTKSVGYDPEKEQYYFSMSDVWDFEPEQYAEIWSDPSSPESKKEMYAQSALMQAAGKPVGLYDRYYLPENYMTDWFGELDIEDKIVAGMKKMDGFWVNEGVLEE